MGDEELSTSADMPVQDINPKPITAKEWNQLSPEERKVIMNLAEKVNGKEQYSTLLYALPYIIEDKGRKLALLPLKGEDYSYEDWVLVDENNKVVEKGIDGNTSSVAGTPLISGYPDFSKDSRRVYPSSELEINGGKADLKEIKINNPLLSNVKKLFTQKYDAPKDGYDGTLSGKVEDNFINPNNITWGEDDFLLDLFDKLPTTELNRLNKFLLDYTPPEDVDIWDDLDEIKVNNPNALQQLMKEKGVDQEWFDLHILKLDELTPEELKDLDYVSDRIDTHLSYGNPFDDEETFEEQFLRERLMHRAGLI
jgi:hypothetical protein